MAEPVDHTQLIDLLEAYLLGEEPSLTGDQLADEVGIPFESARDRWRSLGFTAVAGDVPAFTHADLEALRLTQRLADLGFVDADDEAALVRTLGRSFARLAEWQMRLLARMIDVDEMDLDELRTVMDEIVPAVETLQNYVWRRHTLAVAARLLLAADDEDVESAGETGAEDAVASGVGFADIVNYTRQSRSLSQRELSHLIDGFEARALEIIGAHEGRIVKTIGDEVLFVADEPESIARIGLELVEERLRDEDFPELRVGLAWGPALARLGDVLGLVVNVASRLTSTSRPGRVLVDRSLAEQLQDNEQFKLRRLRRTAVRGYRKLEPWSLRRPADQDPEITQDGSMPGPASSFLHEQAKGLFRGADEVGADTEGSSGGEGVD